MSRSSLSLPSVEITPENAQEIIKETLKSPFIMDASLVIGDQKELPSPAALRAIATLPDSVFHKKINGIVLEANLAGKHAEIEALLPFLQKNSIKTFTLSLSGNSEEDWRQIIGRIAFHLPRDRAQKTLTIVIDSPLTPTVGQLAVETLADRCILITFFQNTLSLPSISTSLSPPLSSYGAYGPLLHQAAHVIGSLLTQTTAAFPPPPPNSMAASSSSTWHPQPRTVFPQATSNTTTSSTLISRPVGVSASLQTSVRPTLPVPPPPPPHSMASSFSSVRRSQPGTLLPATATMHTPSTLVSRPMGAPISLLQTSVSSTMPVPPPPPPPPPPASSSSAAVMSSLASATNTQVDGKQAVSRPPIPNEFCIDTMKLIAKISSLPFPQNMQLLAKLREQASAAQTNLIMRATTNLTTGKEKLVEELDIARAINLSLKESKEETENLPAEKRQKQDTDEVSSTPALTLTRTI